MHALVSLLVYPQFLSMLRYSLHSHAPVPYVVYKLPLSSTILDLFCS